MKFGVGDKNRCCPVCVKFYLNRCRLAAVIAKCLGGSLFWDTVYTRSQLIAESNVIQYCSLMMSLQLLFVVCAVHAVL